LSKIKILVKNQNITQKYKFRTKIESIFKISFAPEFTLIQIFAIFSQILIGNFLENSEKILSKKISVRNHNFAETKKNLKKSYFIKFKVSETLDTGFTKYEKQSYVCEYRPPAPTPPPDQDVCLPCKHNPGVLPWSAKPGCAKPNCGAKLGIVDAWKIGNGKTRPVRYGFIGLIKIPKEIIDSGDAFSVLIRFSKQVKRGHFQLWNMKFWNFYNGGYEVLIHSKWWNSDRHDPYSVAFVAEDLNAEEYPELLFWSNRQTVC